MKDFIRIGIDLGKRYIQIHALENNDGRAVKCKLPRSKFLDFFADVAPCLIGMEACGSAHYWARQLRSMGHDVRLMPPTYVKAYVKRGKNDAVDAAACCEGVSRPDMRFVPVKSEEQQATLTVHRTRELLVRQRTMCVNALRGHLTEFGLVAAKGIGCAGELIEMAGNDAALPEIAKSVVKIFAEQLVAIQASIAALEKQIAGVHAHSPMCQLLPGIPGVGKIIASAIVASVPDPRLFNCARDFAAWIGLVPRQNSTGGKTKLGPITKKGDRYLRKLLVLGATSALRVVGKRKGALRDWLAALLEKKKSARLASVALANKMARIIWAMMTSGEAFRKDMFEPA